MEGCILSHQVSLNLQPVAGSRVTGLFSLFDLHHHFANRKVISILQSGTMQILPGKRWRTVRCSLVICALVYSHEHDILSSLYGSSISFICGTGVHRWAPCRLQHIVYQYIFCEPHTVHPLHSSTYIRSGVRRDCCRQIVTLQLHIAQITSLRNVKALSHLSFCLKYEAAKALRFIDASGWRSIRSSHSPFSTICSAVYHSRSKDSLKSCNQGNWGKL